MIFEWKIIINVGKSSHVEIYFYGDTVKSFIVNSIKDLCNGLPDHR